MRVAQGNDWDVNIRGLLDSLIVSMRIGNNDQFWFLELFGLIIGQGSWGPLGLIGDTRSSELRELNNGSLAYGLRGNSQNILGIWNGSDDSGGQEDFVVSLGDVKVDVS